MPEPWRHRFGEADLIGTAFQFCPPRLRSLWSPTISAGASRIDKRKFTTQHPSGGSEGDVVTARLAGIAAQAEQGEV